MYKLPSARRRKKEEDKLNLIPILDSVFILIFFLLMSAQFLRIYNIGSDLPLYSDSAPPEKDKEDLNLTIEILRNKINIRTGNSLTLVKTFSRDPELESLKEMHLYLLNLKEQYPEEKSVTIKPNRRILYEKLVPIMDQVRRHRKEKELIPLFDELIFSEL